MFFQRYFLLNKVGTIIRRKQILIFFRNGHTLRGKPPGIAKSLLERLKVENSVDPETERKINIGFPKLKLKRSAELKQRIMHLKSQRMNSELEKLVRNERLMIDLAEVKKEYAKTSGQFHLKRIADHYGIFSDLFGSAYFIPRVPLNIKYFGAENSIHPVYCGNVVLPFEAREKPEVSFNGRINLLNENKNDIKYWCLLLTSPDGHFSDGGKECIHWFMGNIPNGNVYEGDEIISYLPPIPARGLGYQRFVFILYKQEDKMPFSGYKITEGCNLDLRTFSTEDFYRHYEDQLTPAGLSFFQSMWDNSITEFCHKKLGLKEPVYEYDFPEGYLTDQKWFPLKQPFNLYLDKHRDIKQVNKEYLERKFAKTHPFKGPEPPLRFPNAHSLKNIPSWLKTEIKKDRLKIGRINDI